MLGAQAAGIAWEAGVLAGLAEGGIAAADADFIVGTSAGSVVGALVAMGREPGSIAAPIIAEADRPREVPGQVAENRPGAPNMMVLFQKMQEAASGERDPEEVRREIGVFALEAETIEEEQFIGGFGRQLAAAGDGAWPGRGYACTAVDCETGAFVVWNAEAGVALSRAVASSCAVPGRVPAHHAEGPCKYMDGGMRSATNADLAKGHDKTLIVALRLGAGEIAERMMRPLEREMAAIRAAGGEVELITPDERVGRRLLAPTLMNPRHRPASARAVASRTVAAGLAGELKRFLG